MLQMYSNKRDEISEPELVTYAVIGLKEAITGETLCDENKITLVYELS